jgi:hypothetical protein
MDRPSMGLLRRPTPGEIMEGGRLGRPCGPGAHSRAISETQFAASPPFLHSTCVLRAPTARNHERDRKAEGREVSRHRRPSAGTEDMGIRR